jgi:hypothetical protein
METLNIEFVDAGEVLVAKMPVNASVHQPMAYCTADFSSISSVGSAAGFLLMQKNKKYVELIGKSFEKYSRRSRYGDYELYKGRTLHLWK